MHHSRLITRGLLAAACAAAAIVAPAAPAASAAAPVVKPIHFPVDGPVSYTDTFGACRGTACERRHEGQDLMGKKMLPLLAAVDGTVLRVQFANTSAGGNSVTLRGADGWTYHYVHVNNDRPGTDDASAARDQVFPNDIVVGAPVRRGQVVGYLGDSGNAEHTAPHLHFEIREPAAPGTYTGNAINAYESLRQASRWAGDERWWLRRSVTAGAVEDLFSYGSTPGDQPLMCDWDGDGVDEPVIYRSGTWYLRSGLLVGATARRITFGTAADTALCGDLDGNGRDEPLIFNAGTWHMRSSFDSTGSVAGPVIYGTVGDVPIVADWDGNGADDLGAVRSGKWYLRTTGTAAGSTRTRFIYGLATDRMVAADWNGDGIDEPGAYRNGLWYLRSSSATSAPTLRRFTLGAPGDQPLAGDWRAGGGLEAGVYRKQPY